MVFERKGFAREMVSNCNVRATTYTVAGWALTEGQHRPKAGKKKKTCEAGLFFLVSAHFSLLDKFCFPTMSFSKSTLIASLTFQQKILPAVYSVGGTKLDLSRNFLFFSKTPGFDSDSEKYTFEFI